MLNTKKPAYWISVRDAFWNFLITEIGLARMYENDVTQMPVIKSIGLTKAVAAGDIYASGIIYDTTNRVQGAEIALGAVALPSDIVDKSNGTATEGGFAYDSVSDISKEFAFGYYLEESDGNYVYYWHPRCKLTQNDDEVETSTDSAPDPNRDFTIKVLPTGEGYWRVRYYTRGVATPLTPAQFFAMCRYTKLPQAASVAVSPAPATGTDSTATVSYVDDATPTTPTTTFQWYSSDTEDGDYAEISGENTASITPDAELVGKYIKVRANVSGSALGLVESAPAIVAA